MAESTVGTRVVRALIDFSSQRGADRFALLSAARTTESALADSEARIPFARYVALTKCAQALCNDPALALHFGEAVDVRDVSLGAASLEPSRSIDDMIGQLNRFARLGVDVPLTDSSARLRVERRGGQVWLVDTRRNANEFPELTELTFAQIVCSTRRYMRDHQAFDEVRVTHPNPGYASEYQRVFRMPVVFGSARNELALRESVVAAFSGHRSSPVATQIVRAHAERQLASLDTAETTRGRVESHLTSMLRGQKATMDRIAGLMGLSRQTLSRKLRIEGVTFQTILAELRLKLALHHLDDGRTSVKQAAMLLGYSDAAAFSRAFKRWTGVAPRRRSAGRNAQ